MDSVKIYIRREVYNNKEEGEIFVEEGEICDNETNTKLSNKPNQASEEVNITIKSEDKIFQQIKSPHNEPDESKYLIYDNNKGMGSFNQLIITHNLSSSEENLLSCKTIGTFPNNT